MFRASKGWVRVGTMESGPWSGQQKPACLVEKVPAFAVAGMGFTMET